MFGKRLREIRSAQGLTLEELAARYNARFGGGLNKGTLSKYENEKQEPMVSTVQNLSVILDVSADYLLGQTDVYSPLTLTEKEDSLIINNRNGKSVKIVLTPEQLERAQKALELIIPEALEDQMF